MASKAAKRRARKDRQEAETLPDIAPIPRREANGRVSRKGQVRGGDIETLTTRCNQMGKGITPANLREARAPWWGCWAGRAIARAEMPDHEREALWTAIVHMRRVVAAHDAAIGLPRRHAICLRLLAPVDEMHADAETPPADLRTDAEKRIQADAALMRLETWLGYTDKRAQSIAKRVVIEDMPCQDDAALISALRCVSDGVRGKRPVYRGLKKTS
jgi:hypothetical protein